MKMNPHLFLATILAILSSCTTMNAQETPKKGAPIEGIEPKHFTTTINADYLLYLPHAYQPESTNRWPLILFLHGAGERGTDVWRTAIHGPTKYLKTHPDFPFIFASPQCPPGEKWSDDILMKLLDSLCEQYRVDTNRIYLTGLSMGGFGTWSLATTYPERFAAVAPIAGGEGSVGAILSEYDPAKKQAIKTLPIWAFHGAKDPVVPIRESQRMVEIFKALGNTNINLTVYPEAQHDAWTATYSNPKLYAWFLSHQRGTNN